VLYRNSLLLQRFNEPIAHLSSRAKKADVDSIDECNT
jgi:hypothetical protein